MKQQISLKYAKSTFKKNMYKYDIVSNFENSILEYNLNQDEITKLYDYVVKITRDSYNLKITYQNYIK